MCWSIRSPQARDAWSFAPVLCHPTYAQGIKDLSNAAVPLAEMVKSKCLGLPKLDQPARTFSNCFLYVHAHAEEGAIGHSSEPIEAEPRKGSCLPNSSDHWFQTMARQSPCSMPAKPFNR